MKYKTKPEMFLFAADKMDVPEIKIRYNRSTRKPSAGVIKSSTEAARFIRSTFKRGEIEAQEHFIVLYLDQANQIKGYYRHTAGTINATLADIRIILAGALKSLSVSIIVAHNHPSGNLRPSQADISLTEQLKKAATSMNIHVADHVIVTKEGYFSFADEGLLGLDKPSLNEMEVAYVHLVETMLDGRVKQNRIGLEKIAAEKGITDKTQVKELTELAIVKAARKISLNQHQSLEQKYKRIVELYEGQVNLSHRTSQSILLQQYSTPSPIAFLAGIFCGVDKLKGNELAFEPSAGNGLLTIAGQPVHFIVNEIDYTRNRNLHSQPFLQVTSRDASLAFSDYKKRFQAVITNPPFGRLDDNRAVRFDEFTLRELDHVMAVHALDCLKDNGRAAIIIGGHTDWDDKGRVQSGKNRIFLNYLYHHYHVSDVLLIDGGKLYSRQGTSFDVRLILISGRKPKPNGAAPLFDRYKDVSIRTFDELFERVMYARQGASEARHNQLDLQSLIQKGRSILTQLSEEELGAPYIPASQSCVKLDTQVPDSMDFEIHSAVQRVKEAVGGDIDNFVRHRLGFNTKLELCKALSAEQIDAVALAIYNIEARAEGMIIGDQTGIGKGRIAAAVIRYAKHQGILPVFITEKPNLFSDIYRDLSAISSAHLRPFIVNAKETKSDVKNEDGEVVHQALPYPQQREVFNNPDLLNKFDYVVSTYSQFNSPEKKPEKPGFLLRIAGSSLLILDEAHNASGSSNTGAFLANVVNESKGVVFLSATFAKRPDNMPIYAMKTAIREANMSRDELVAAIVQGGVAMQEILASQLVSEGQMIRRERSFEGVEVNYTTLDQMKAEHEAIADNVTNIIRDIIAFQEDFVANEVEELDKIAAELSQEVKVRGGTSKAGVDNMPYFSKVFNVINQMLFSVKAIAVADKAIERLREGKKPVIAFASTMGSFIEQMENAQGLPVSDGDVIRADFSEVLRRGLQGVLRYTERDIAGNPSFKTFSLSSMTVEAQQRYKSILNRIESVSTGISISPIDVIIGRIEAAGYSVAEVTGRKYSLQINDKTDMGLIRQRKRINTNDAFRQYNNNEVDVLMINQSGSTGASAHAIVTAKVPASQVKQRVMIVLQAELDINTEVQKRGRINRTGQILKPIYDYVISAIPAEKRLMMMLQQKLKSLDANTTSNQKQSTKILDVADFLNKYGDKIVKDYLIEHPEVNKLLGDPLGMIPKKKAGDEETEDAPEIDREEAGDDETDKKNRIEDAAHKVSGRVAVLAVKMQQAFYEEVTERYNDYVEYLKQVGEYDLEVETLNLQAETTESKVLKMGKGGISPFGEDSLLEKVKANVLKKPFKRTELENVLADVLKGREADTIHNELVEPFRSLSKTRLTDALERLRISYQKVIDDLPNSKRMQKILDQQGSGAFQAELKIREAALTDAMNEDLGRTQKKFENLHEYLEKVFDFFRIGRPVKFPMSSFDIGREMVYGVSLGVEIDLRKTNPYAPSSVKVKIALANSLKMVTMHASYTAEIMGIIGASTSMSMWYNTEVLDTWEQAVMSRQTDRDTRYIITGNLLQAFGEESGKLVSYTTQDGGVKKGILLPEHWWPKDESTSMTVPVSYAAKIIKSVMHGRTAQANDGVTFGRQGPYIKVMVPASRQRGGNIYLDQELLSLVEGNNFQKVANHMSAMLPDENVDAFLEILQRKHNISMHVPQHQYHLIERKRLTYKLKPIQLPPPEEETPIIPINIIEIRARALKLKMQLNLAA